MDLAEGLRAALGITVPAAAGLLAGHLVWGIICSFATLWILMCDVGGAYRQKAVNLVASAVTILCAFAFGGWMIQSVPNYIIGTFLWVFLAALIGVAGNAAAQAGLVSSTIVVTSVVLFVPREFLIRSVLCLIGFSWAVALSLALWPVRPFSPLFRALSDSSAKLAELAGAFWSGAATPKRPADNLEFAVAYDAFMNSLERCRNIWGAVRAGRAGPTLRSMQLLALIEQLDDIARILVTLREEINLFGREQWFDECRADLARLIQSLWQLSRETAEAVAVRGKNVEVTALQHAFQIFDGHLLFKPGEQSRNKELQRTTKHLVEEATALAETVSELKSGRANVHEPPEAQFGPRPETFDPIGEIRNNLSLRSSSFRHALRLGVATAIAAFAASAIHLVRGYWIPMTVVIVLKPNFGGTLQRAVQRITGTVLGALLASVLLLVLKNPWALLPTLAFLTFATFALRNCNYTLFSFALTPMIMLMLDIAHPITVADSFLRIVNTAIGSVLALLSGYLLFPMWESRRLPFYIAEALRAEATFARGLRDVIRKSNERPMAEYRRDAVVAVSNAVTAGQRLLSEPPRHRGDVASSLAAVNYCRRLVHVLAAISDYPTRKSVQLRSDELAGFFEALDQSFDHLAESLVTGKRPGVLSNLSLLLEQMENNLQQPSSDKRTVPSLVSTQNGLSSATLFYHLRNAVDLTLEVREVIARMQAYG
jgi:uncharacterized membrane protein YccC